MLLKKITIHKFKCFESIQTFDVEDDVTVLVGLNESGKTSVLQAAAKTNYFDDDANFKFNLTHDYPRKEKKAIDKSGENPESVTSTYSLSQDLRNKINDDIGGTGFNTTEINITSKYKGGHAISTCEVDIPSVLASYHAELAETISGLKSQAELIEILKEIEDNDLKDAINNVKRLYENKWNWPNPIAEYVARVWILPSRPKYLYYDEYYALPSRISIEDLQKETLISEELKTAKALFELADIDIEELINSDEFEDFKAELEATEAKISEELFKYWSTNRNLEIQFAIDKIEKTITHNQSRIVEHVLDIRVRNNRAKISLPLKNRSKGFNWFFSFLVWFKKIQEDNSSNYILLLDEPGLNLHAAAQGDLLEFIESLSEKYQVIFTTHSPFMVSPEKLHRTRTVLETETGSVVSDSLQEKDPNTLFPLQAALGYHLAQNLYVSKKNLLVEGVSDLVYLQVVSATLEGLGRIGLSNDITIVPVGGMEKIATFVSLLRGSKLNIVCLLDSTIGQSGNIKLERLVSDKIIKEQKILHYRDQIADAEEADVEDLFNESDYLKLFNGCFTEHTNIKKSDLASFSNKRIVQKINLHLTISRFNHYRPSNYLAQEIGKKIKLSDVTLDNFEAMIGAVNAAMEK